MKSRKKSSVSSQIRIIGGRYKGRKLIVSEGPGLRPTGNRIRETVFNWLAPYLEGASCIDLFTGSGALAIEAASRGAENCFAFDTNQSTCAAIKQSLKQFDCSTVNVYNNDSIKWLNTYAGKIDIAFVDPPFSEDLHDISLNALCNHSGVHEDTLIYVEAARDTVIAVPEGWSWWREKHAGDVLYGVIRQD